MQNIHIFHDGGKCTYQFMSKTSSLAFLDNPETNQNDRFTFYLKLPPDWIELFMQQIIFLIFPQFTWILCDYQITLPLRKRTYQLYYLFLSALRAYSKFSSIYNGTMSCIRIINLDSTVRISLYCLCS